MDDLTERVATPCPTDSASPAKQSARPAWRRAALYLLALLGLIFVLLLALMAYRAYQQKQAGGTELAAGGFDEADMIDSVMTDAYGKYSEDKRGWLYVYNDDQTYVMRVIQQVKLDDAPAGPELYFLASGTPLSGERQHNSIYAAYHIYPDPEKPGGLKQTHHQVWQYSRPLAPEDVRFVKLSKTAWAWILKTRSGDGKEEVANETVTILAPHKEQVVQLAEFPAAARYRPDSGCADLEQEYGAYSAIPADEWEEGEQATPQRCQDRRWSYKLGNTDANIPAPITVTLSGTEVEQPIEAKTWKIVFDSKVYRYNVPDDIAGYRTPAPKVAPKEPESAAPEAQAAAPAQAEPAAAPAQ